MAKNIRRQSRAFRAFGKNDYNTLSVQQQKGHEVVSDNRATYGIGSIEYCERLKHQTCLCHIKVLEMCSTL